MARPREFDEHAVLEAVRDMFWVNGYEGTSMRDLVQVTGLTQPSLYNAFGDKQALFVRSFEDYLDRTLRARIKRLEASTAPGLAITTFFHEIIERSVADPQKRGCMLVNTALQNAPDDAGFRETLAREIEQLGEFFHRCLLAGHARGEIPPTVEADDAARHLLAVLLGLRVMARVRPERALLTGAVATALTLLGLPPLPTADDAPAGAPARDLPA